MLKVSVLLAFSLALPAVAQQEPAMPAPTPAEATTPAIPAPAPPTAAKKKGKQPYTGPTTVVELPPTPMLDAEGRQQLDPDAHPMFNAPVHQLRDKQGHPVFDDKNQPVFQTADNRGFDEHGKKIHVKKEKAPKAVSLSIDRGTLTVDGMTGKAALNYQIADLHYIYVYAPWIGLVVVSNTPFPNAKAQPNAFDDKSLTVTVADHVLQVSSDKRLLGKKPAPAFVLVDRDFHLPTKFPVMGYGPIRKPPYAWPGSKQNEPLKNAAIEAPPLPENLRPSLLLEPCPPGQMRQGGPPALPGETAPVPPCTLITKGKPATGSQPEI
jgi:hypothetical protein